jgi:hypothetical protein
VVRAEWGGEVKDKRDGLNDGSVLRRRETGRRGYRNKRRGESDAEYRLNTP